MNDFDDTQTLSTVLDVEPGPSASGGGMPSLSEPAEPASLRADLVAAFKEEADKPKLEPEVKAADAKADDAKPEAAPEKPEPAKEAKVEEPKPDAPAAKPVDPEPKPVVKDDTEDKPGDTRHEPPKNFLPDSKEVWRNVPRAVRRDIDAMVQEREAERAQHQEVTQRYDRLRDFDELAHSNGRDLRESLTQLHHVENLMQRNPVAGLNAILQQIGPRKADGQSVSLMEVAQFIVSQGPDGYQQIVAQGQQAPQQQQPNPEVQQLRAQVQEMQHQQIAQGVIEPFKAAHPRFEELQGDIAFFLQSGKIPTTLSQADRLAAAYGMAERINPPSHAPEPATILAGPGSEARRAEPDLSGSRSIKSSPGSVTEEVEDQATGSESIRDSLRKEMRRLRA